MFDPLKHFYRRERILEESAVEPSLLDAVRFLRTPLPPSGEGMRVGFIGHAEGHEDAVSQAVEGATLGVHGGDATFVSLCKCPTKLITCVDIRLCIKNIIRESDIVVIVAGGKDSIWAIKACRKVGKPVGVIYVDES